MELLTQRYRDKILGTLSCYDRVVITGTLPRLCYAEGMTRYLKEKGIRIFDYPRFAEPYREQLRENAQSLAKANGIQIHHIRKSHIRKEDIVKGYLQKRGDAPGLVCILSAMESCESYKPWHNKNTHQTYLIATSGKCLHYYFYFMDETLGLVYVRVPTWCPFRLQIYFNGHHYLASRLSQAGIDYQLLDNAFVNISDFAKAQALADKFDIKRLHHLLDQYANTCCPIINDFEQVYHWSIMQAEYATDIIFRRQVDLQDIYQQLIQSAIHTVTPENIATFLGQKFHGKYQGEMGNRYNVRIQGSRIKHSMGACAIKMYDKFAHILRIETTTNNVSFFKHYRTVEHRDGSNSQKFAPMKKSIYSLNALKECLQAANHRYLVFISAIEDHSVGRKKLFQRHLKTKNSGQISRLLKRLRTHGLIKKIGNTYKYYLTNLGKQVILTALKIKELVVIPQLNYLRTA